MSNYCNTQTAPVLAVKSMPCATESRNLSQQADAFFAEVFGPRHVTEHVKASRKGPWHFSPRAMHYIMAYPGNKTVFYLGDTFVGWADHTSIEQNWYDCGAGRCFSGPLFPMESFR